MKTCKVLQPPVNTPDGVASEEGAMVVLENQDAKALAELGVVEIVCDSGECPMPKPESNPETVESSDETTPSETTLLNLNTATPEEIEALPHVGKATAQKLIKARPIESEELILKATGLKAAQWEEIKPLVTW